MSFFPRAIKRILDWNLSDCNPNTHTLARFPLSCDSVAAGKWPFGSDDVFAIRGNCTSSCLCLCVCRSQNWQSLWSCVCVCVCVGERRGEAQTGSPRPGMRWHGTDVAGSTKLKAIWIEFSFRGCYCCRRRCRCRRRCCHCCCWHTVLTSSGDSASQSSERAKRAAGSTGAGIPIKRAPHYSVLTDHRADMKSVAAQEGEQERATVKDWTFQLLGAR